MDDNNHCKDSKLNDTSSKENMEQNGWIFDITKHKQDKYIVHCGDDSWFGHSAYWEEGSVSATFKGSGAADLVYGNCWMNHNVDVYLNQQKISFASGGQTRKEVTFSFVKGDILKLQEDGAIIKIYSLEIKC